VIRHESPRHEQIAGLGLLFSLVLAAAVRIALVDFEGHSGDVLIIHRWAERLAEVGSWGFYEGTVSGYPALLYVYWPLGLLLDGESLDLVIKGMSIPFDLAIGLVLWVLVRRIAGGLAALGAAALYLLNPAVLIAGPLWGQIDAAGTLVAIVALLAASSRRWVLAGALVVLAGMVKPQFGLVALPVVVAAFRAWQTEGGWSPVRRSALGAVATYAVIAAPLLLDPLRYTDQLYEVATFRSFVSLFALNPWGLLVGFEVPEGNLAWVGLALLLIGLVAACVPAWRRQDLRALLVAGTLIVFAFYFLPTRSHERYLFPAMALLAPFAATSVRVLAAYVVLTLAFAASLVHAMAYASPGALPAEVLELMRTDAAPWIIGVPLIGSALVVTWLTVRGEGAGDAAAAAEP
jgi:dolichyl-phosphate-mannose-protein mannosyltransferase